MNFRTTNPVKKGQVLMDLYASKSASLPQKITITLTELILIGVSAWVLFGPGETILSGLFGWVPPQTPPSRRWIVLAFSVIVLLRIAFTMFYIMKRAIPWPETLSVPAAFALYYVGFAILALPAGAPIGMEDWLAIILFLLGSWFNSAGEWQRHKFKERPENKGKLYTGGLFGLSMHINFFGDILWVTAYAMVTQNIWAWSIPILITAFFMFYNVPMLDRYLAQRYDEDFASYADNTKRLIPFIW